MKLDSLLNLVSPKKKKKVALVLSGGAARGVAHLGVIKVLQDNEVPIDLVVGTSIGSLMGAVHAAGLDLNEAFKLAYTFTWKDFVDLTYKGLGLFPGKKLRRTIDLIVGNLTFEDLGIPLIITTTDLETGESVLIRSGPLAPAIRASCAIPGIFSPIEVEGRLLFDGGVLENLPVNTARQEGADIVIAVDVGYFFKKKRPQNIIEVIYKAFLLKGEALVKYHRLNADILLTPELPEVDQMDFHKGAQCIEGGMQVAQKALPEILKLTK